MERSVIDQLLLALTGSNSGPATRQLTSAGYTEEEIRAAWNAARASGFTESTGLGQDRLTDIGRARARELNAD